MNLGALIGLTQELKQVYIDTAKEVGFKPGPEHFGYQVRALVADTDEKAQELGHGFMWAQQHRMRGPVEHNDPPGYQSRVASQLATRRLGGGGGPPMTYEDLQEVKAVIVGSPETVTKKLADTIKQLSPGYMILIGSDGKIPHQDVMRSVELLGKEVIPALHEIELEPYA
jgi:alkanesulfonate monooxygenase SsuD/methylene tetrahydromethanopterin reductase-like flavin-dependent oxidoreductase (luciferase family)